MSDTSDPLEILDAIDRERGDSFIGMIQANQVRRLRAEIVALRGFRDECERQFQEQVAETGRLLDRLRSARDEALEEAAQRCDRLATDYTIPISADNWSAGCRGCGGRIRALREKRDG